MPFYEPTKKQVVSKHPTESHYDMDIDFFRSFLDPYMKYTSGLYTTGNESLELACEQMLDLIIDSAKLPEKSNILEIGSGWGSLIRRISDRKKMWDYTGISPSKSQNNYLRSLQIPRSRFLDSTFERIDFEESELFDAIFLVGTFCHLTSKPQMLKKMKKYLSPNGKIIIEDSFFLSEKLFQNNRNDPRTAYLQKKVFGYAEIPSLAAFTDMIRESELILSVAVDYTDSYKKTIDTWIKRLAENLDSNDQKVKTFTNYLQIAQAGWNYTTSNYLAILEYLPLEKNHRTSRTL